MLWIWKGDCGRFHKIALSIDKLQSKCDQKSTNHKRRYSYKKAIRRLQIKIQKTQKNSNVLLVSRWWIEILMLQRISLLKLYKKVMVREIVGIFYF